MYCDIYLTIYVVKDCALRNRVKVMVLNVATIFWFEFGREEYSDCSN